jgi:hypothetical protein
VPVVLVEIERNAVPEIVDSGCRTLKELSAECLGCAIVTEALAAMRMRPDSDRRREFWVPDFTKAEAREYLAKANEWRRGRGKSEFSGVEIDDVLARLGRRPSTLFNLMQSDVPVAQFVETRIAEEGDHITDLLNVDPHYAPVLRALLEKQTLSRPELANMLHQTIMKIAVVAMSGNHVLSYNPVTCIFQFHSTATAEAAKRWAAKEAKKSWLTRPLKFMTSLSNLVSGNG